jgi:pimeloyl-ACP methyl ester carboxylesterase
MEIPFDWSVLGSDVAAVLAAAHHRTTIGVGHSSGGAAIAAAAIDDPAAFDRLILIEPIITPPPNRRHENDSMAATAERRRSSFPGREAALDHFRGKGPFARWVDDALEAYVDGALRRVGGELVLKCSPRTEAEHYRSGWAHSMWDRLGEITCPVILVAGAESTTHGAEALAGLAAQFAQVEIVVIPAATHFAPMEHPDAVAGVIASVVRRADHPG